MNVMDHLKHLSTQAIKNYCAETCVDAAVAMTHIEGDFNLGNVFRSTNFFGIREAYYIGGGKQYDRRSCVGVQNYTPITFCKTYDDFWNMVGERGYTPVAIENNVNYDCKNLFNYVWPEKPVIIFGEERIGVPPEILDKCRDVVSIPGFGSVRSLNVASAASLAIGMYRRHLESKLVGT
jgi:tRNA G18 (ribose-2'-O)-methylase SpoU